MQCGAASATSGLSPRVRGSHGQVAPDARHSGSIPASAGEPRSADVKVRSLLVYPRECGGATSEIPPSSYRTGLSPRVRGSRLLWPCDNQGVGSIPASAGEPGCLRALACSQEVYPRECGGALLQVIGAMSLEGLSPRVRGSRRYNWTDTQGHRSIPASAGEPAGYTVRDMEIEVYPRECGGANSFCPLIPLLMGLSPRVRGSRYAHGADDILARSIPASAGEPTRA